MSFTRHLSAMALLSVGALAQPCCGVSPEEAIVTFRGQQNVIVWDPATKTEHFIRKADFDSQNKGMGFIAPSPTKPELGEADPGVFVYLQAMMPPPEGLKAAGSPDYEASVQVVEEQDVAGYRAVILKASDGAALAAWLTANGFVSTPDIEAWVKPYVDKGWYFTAFKVLPGKFETTTGLVRMSFKTDQPFNPYSVPKSNGIGTGNLVVFFVSPAKFEGKIGGDMKWVREAWFAKNMVDRDKLSKLIGAPLDGMPAKLSVSRWEDPKFPQPGNDDIFFEPVHESSAYSVTGPALGGVAVVLIASHLARRRRKTAPVDAV